jgi:hypothetical protein
MFGIHGHAQPDVLDLDVLEPVSIKAFDVIFVAVRGNNQIEPLRALLLALGQLARQVLHGLLEKIVSALLAAVYKDMKPVVSTGNPDVDAISASHVEGAD